MDRIPFEWVEHTEGRGPTEFAFENDGSQSSLVIQFRGEHLSIFAQNILGYAKRTVPGRIDRRTPARNPYFPWQRAVKVSTMRGMGKTTIAAGQIGNPPPPVRVHEVYQATVIFQSLPYDVLEDGEVYDGGRTEFDRYVTKLATPTARGLSLERGAFVFIEGPATGRSFNNAPSIVVGNTSLVWTWHLVPTASIFDNDGHPTRIADTLGKVNNEAFGGYPAGTLLLESATLTPVTAPVPPAVLGLNPLQTPRLWNVGYNVLHNPYGHNKVPYGVDGNWYTVAPTTDSTTRLYQSASYRLLFQGL